MRKLGQELGVEAMALYRHVRNKDDLLDGIVEVIVGEIERPAPPARLEGRAPRAGHGARAVMLRHPWAPRVFEERGAPGPATLGYIEASSGSCATAASRSDLAHHASTCSAAASSGSTRTSSTTAAGGAPRRRRPFGPAMAARIPRVASWPGGQPRGRLGGATTTSNSRSGSTSSSTASRRASAASRDGGVKLTRKDPTGHDRHASRARPR